MRLRASAAATISAGSVPSHRSYVARPMTNALSSSDTCGSRSPECRGEGANSMPSRMCGFAPFADRSTEAGGTAHAGCANAFRAACGPRWRKSICGVASTPSGAAAPSIARNVEACGRSGQVCASPARQLPSRSASPQVRAGAGPPLALANAPDAGRPCSFAALRSRRSARASLHGAPCPALSIRSCSRARRIKLGRIFGARA